MTDKGFERLLKDLKEEPNQTHLIVTERGLAAQGDFGMVMGLICSAIYDISKKEHLDSEKVADAISFAIKEHKKKDLGKDKLN